MLIFYKQQVEDSELSNVGVYMTFIIYNPDNGETAFFNVFSRGEFAEDGDIEPFNDAQMAVVNSRYLNWCTENGQVYADPAFNIDRHKEFMRGL